MKWHNWSRANPNFESTKLATISFGNGSKTIHMSFCRQCIMKRIISWSLPYPLWFLWQSAIQKYFKTRDNLSQTRHMSTEQDLGGICRHISKVNIWTPPFLMRTPSPSSPLYFGIFSEQPRYKQSQCWQKNLKIQTPFCYLFLFPWIVHNVTEVIRCSGRLS